jgi:hypothetical protein
LGDLAAEINRARLSSCFDGIKTHLANMATGAVRMNSKSAVTDEAANKNSELYVGCLALGAGLNIELENPDKSANGKNPDILLVFENSDWSIAVKASHGPSAPTIFGNIKKGVEQIERSGTKGIVFVNLKNILQHRDLASASPFCSVMAATDAIGKRVDKIAEAFQREIAVDDWAELFSGKRARPLVALMGQITVSTQISRGPTMLVPAKVMRIFHAPPIASDAVLTVVDAAAWRLLEKLNHELQRNAGSKTAIGDR